MSLIGGSKSKAMLMSEIKTDLPEGLDKFPYINAHINTSVRHIIDGKTVRDKNFTQINTRMYLMLFRYLQSNTL